MKVPPQRDFPPRHKQGASHILWVSPRPSVIPRSCSFWGLSSAVTLIGKAPKCPSPAFWRSAWKLREINGFAGAARGGWRGDGRGACKLCNRASDMTAQPLRDRLKRAVLAPAEGSMRPPFVAFPRTQLVLERRAEKCRRVDRCAGDLSPASRGSVRRRRQR